ncbi:MAG: GNAT family N-acetyltransferase, partial [Actinomycetota bacterium]|nr:GNAT family N-acetyltransferase [Actinomycetota bacterium]
MNPDTTMAETITFLEMTDPAELREPSVPARVEHSFRKVHDAELNRSLYEEIGGPHGWIDRLRWSDRQWAAWEAGVETWVAEVEGSVAGYCELRVDRESTLISIFGVREAYRG